LLLAPDALKGKRLVLRQFQVFIVHIGLKVAIQRSRPWRDLRAAVLWVHSLIGPEKISFKIGNVFLGNMSLHVSWILGGRCELNVST